MVAVLNFSSQSNNKTNNLVSKLIKVGFYYFVIGAHYYMYACFTRTDTVSAVTSFEQMPFMLRRGSLYSLFYGCGYSAGSASHHCRSRVSFSMSDIFMAYVAAVQVCEILRLQVVNTARERFFFKCKVQVLFFLQMTNALGFLKVPILNLNTSTISLPR